MKKLGGLLALLALLALAPPSRATPPSDAVRAYHAAGMQAYRTGQYALALRAYQEAYRLDPRPEIAFSMAQASRLLFFETRDPGELERALQLYRNYLRDAPAGRRRAHAVQHVAALEAMQALSGAQDGGEAGRGGDETLLMVVSSTPRARARIDGGEAKPLPMAQAVSAGSHRVVVSAPGHHSSTSTWPAVKGRLVVASVVLRQKRAEIAVEAPSGATVLLDGETVGQSPLPRVLRTRPGRHEITVVQAGHLSRSKRLTVGPGRRARARFDALPTSSGRRASHWLFGASGALCLASGVSLAVALAAEQRALDYRERIGAEPLGREDLVARGDDVETRDAARAAGLTLLGGAALAAGAGLVVFLVDARHTQDLPRDAGQIEPWLGPGGFGIRWREGL